MMNNWGNSEWCHLCLQGRLICSERHEFCLITVNIQGGWLRRQLDKRTYGDES